MRQLFVLLAVLLISCSNARKETVLYAPTSIRVPTKGIAPNFSASSVAVRTQNWTKVWSGTASTWFVRGGDAYRLLRETSTNYRMSFPYLLRLRSGPVRERLVALASRAHSGSGGSPSPGLAIVHESPDAYKIIDFTYRRTPRSEVLTVADSRRSVMLNLYESDCTACVSELVDVIRAASQIKKVSGATFLITSARGESLRPLFSRVGRQMIVVTDFEHSIYGTLDVKHLPVTYFLDGSGAIVSSELGAASWDDLRQDIAELAKR